MSRITLSVSRRTFALALHDQVTPSLPSSRAIASARQLLAGQMRYARTIKSIDPAGYAGGIISHPFPLALAALLIGGGGQALALAAVALTCRMALCWHVERQFAARTGDYWLVPLRDLLSFTVYVASFFGATVKWRGQRYRVVDDTLVADPH